MLMEDAENELVHMITFIGIAEPSLLERIMAMATLWFSYVDFFLLYLVSSCTAWLVTWKLEQVSYTLCLQEID